MKGTRIQYETVNSAPANAITVRNYAESKGLTVAAIYKQYNTGKLKIVTFQGINFVLS